MTLYERLPDAVRETVDEIVEVLRPEPSRLTVPKRKDAAKGRRHTPGPCVFRPLNPKELTLFVAAQKSAAMCQLRTHAAQQIASLL